MIWTHREGGGKWERNYALLREVCSRRGIEEIPDRKISGIVNALCPYDLPLPQWNWPMIRRREVWGLLGSRYQPPLNRFANLVYGLEAIGYSYRNTDLDYIDLRALSKSLPPISLCDHCHKKMRRPRRDRQNVYLDRAFRRGRISRSWYRILLGYDYNKFCGPLCYAASSNKFLAINQFIAKLESRQKTQEGKIKQWLQTA